MESSSNISKTTPTPLYLLLPNRPNRNPNLTNMKKIAIFSNHFPFTISQQQKQFSYVYIYSIATEPEIPLDSRKRFREIVEKSNPEIKKDLGNYILAGRNVFSFNKKDVHLTYTSKIDATEFLVIIKYTRTTDLQNLFNVQDDAIKVSIQAMNILIKETNRKLGMTEIGKDRKFFYNDTQNINYLDQYYLQIRRGFKTSINMDASGTRILIDSCTKVMRMDTVFEYIQNFEGNNNDVKEYLIGESVVADYGSNHRIYKIFDIDYTKSPKSTFFFKRR